METGRELHNGEECGSRGLQRTVSLSLVRYAFHEAYQSIRRTRGFQHSSIVKYLSCVNATVRGPINASADKALFAPFPGKIEEMFLTVLSASPAPTRSQRADVVALKALLFPTLEVTQL